jgi:HEAT repeat protein
MLAHEALITEWAELQDWLNDHRAQLERIQRLVTGLTSSEHEDRFHAVNALCAINPMTDEVFTALIGALRIDDVSVRCAAAYAIGEIGPAALEGTPELITALTDTSAWVRRNAAQALGKIGGTAEVIPALITALKDDYKWVRMRAAEALGQFGPLSIEAVPTLIGALEDVDADVIYNARDALKRIQS